MDTAELVVAASAAGAIAFVLWYFFGARAATAATAATAAALDERGAQHVRVVVKGSYSPDTIVVRRGRPVRIDFHREESSSCTEQVVFADFGIVRDLPAFETTSVEFTPERSGQFTFACGMNMVRGKLIVQD